MGRLKITPELLERAAKTIGKGSIRTNEGVSRKELRALERAGIVKKSKVFARKVFTGSNPAMHYIWEMVNKNE